MKKLIFTATLILCCVFAAQSQSEYKTALGLRFGYPNSISLKHFLSEKNAVEVFAGYRRWSRYYNDFRVGALYLVHSPIEDVEGLKWYLGGGATAIFNNYDNVYYASDNYGNVNLGIMGALGLDYKFVDYPINLSLDWVPTFVIGEGAYNGFRADAGALSARYTFK
ncbi:MAG: hypothetical protein ACKVUS_15205 [Saprospiraceae bacterium]